MREETENEGSAASVLMAIMAMMMYARVAATETACMHKM